MIVMMGIGNKEKSKDMESILLLMVIIIKENLLKEWGMEKVSINGLMEVIMMENGNRIKWMEEECIEVVMGQLQKEYFRMIILLHHIIEKNEMR